MSVDLLKRRVPAIDQVTQVVDRRWLVLDKDEQEVQRQGRQRLSIARLIDCTDVRDTLRVAKEPTCQSADQEGIIWNTWLEYLHNLRSRS